MWLARKWHSPSSMPSSLIQVALKCAILGLVFVPTNHHPIKPKRSPLEIGLISFTNSAKSHPTALVNKTVTVTKSIKSTVEVPFHPRVVIPTHFRHTWVPGHVTHHAFIPAHAHHVLVPTHALLLPRTLHTVLVPPDSEKLGLYDNDSDIFRSHVGGFGVGVDFGGQGAGHGFHVSF